MLHLTVKEVIKLDQRSDPRLYLKSTKRNTLCYPRDEQANSDSQNSTRRVGDETPLGFLFVKIFRKDFTFYR